MYSRPSPPSSVPRSQHPATLGLSQNQMVNSRFSQNPGSSPYLSEYPGTIPSLSQHPGTTPSLSEQAGFFRARTNSLPVRPLSSQATPSAQVTAMSRQQPPSPPHQLPPPPKVLKSEYNGKGDVFRDEDKFVDTEEAVFSPMVQVAGDTGCGSTVYKPLAAFSAKEDRNMLSSKIDEEMSSCRTPLEVLSDIMSDKDQLENIPDDVIKRVLAKSEKLKDPSPPCTCLPSNTLELSPYYVYLGHAATKAGLRTVFEERLGLKGRAIRMEEVRFTGKEGKTSEDCPIAKWVLRRSEAMEQMLVVVKHRYGHHCKFAWQAVAIVVWEGLTKELADRAYTQLAYETSRFGTETDRQCAANKKKTCACQGLDMGFSGASYTFGCSWTMYHNICKFCRSMEVHKFKLSDINREESLENICTELVDTVSPIFKKLSPDVFNNMCLFEEVAADCRIGTTGQGGRPFSGITCVCDFCAHAHKDTNNMIGGSTCVVTLKRPGGDQESEDEQLHVLPLYVPVISPAELEAKVASGGLEVFNKFTRTIAIRETKKAACRRGRLALERKRMLDGSSSKDCSLGEGLIPQMDGNTTLSSSDEEGGMSSMENSLNSSANLSSSLLDSSTDPVDELVENMKLTIHESDCLEAFDDPDIGGVAFGLPHGSLLIEVAKQEVHATTAIKKPDRSNPHRIGLVFYQHKQLHLPAHGAEEFNRKRAIREFRDYVQWLKGNYVPTEAKLRAMSESGFVFPAEVKTVAKPMDVANPEDFFKSDTSLSQREESSDGEKLVQDPADRELDNLLPVFQAKELVAQDEPAVEDEINLTPRWEDRGEEGLLTNEEKAEVRMLEEELSREFRKQ